MQMLPTFGTIHFQKLLTPQEVVSVIEFLKKTGEVQLPDHPGAKLNFVEGKLVHAKLNEVEGDEAAIAALRIPELALSFTIGPKTKTETVKAPLKEIIEKSLQPEPPTKSVMPKEPVPEKSTPTQDPKQPAVEKLAAPDLKPSPKASDPPVPDTKKTGHGTPAGAAKPAAGAKPVLRITLKGVSKDFPIVAGKVMSIGRTPENDICIPDGQISTRHATLELGAKGMHLVDNDSMNGIHLDGKTVKELWLKPNDKFSLGEIPVTVTLA